jgi:hypothetical protein
VTVEVIASKVLSSLRAKRSNLPSRHCEQSEAISKAQKTAASLSLLAVTADVIASKVLFVIASKAKQSQKHKRLPRRYRSSQ